MAERVHTQQAAVAAVRRIAEEEEEVHRIALAEEEVAHHIALEVAAVVDTCMVGPELAVEGAVEVELADNP